MANTLVHRGPDDAGTWHNAYLGVGLAHRRLSIQDLSQDGHQPMASECGRYVVVYNGEIYNFRDLRTTLEKLGHKFRGGSDTEVATKSFMQWGIEASLTRFVGMFAFAICDLDSKVLTLVRDRLGEKPVYYGYQGNSFLFASELRAMRTFPGWRGHICRDALQLFLQNDCIAAPYSIYEGIYKLRPGCLLEIPLDGVRRAGPADEVTYWSLHSVVEQGRMKPFHGSTIQAVDSLERHLETAVTSQMVADVPIGAFLSGGVDSSLIAALMQANSSVPIRTFSIGFEEEQFDESRYASAVAAHIQSAHTTLKVGHNDLLDAIPNLPNIWDEPFGDSSQIPTFLVSCLARSDVTVSLSGDGGDEVFAGYGLYRRAEQLWNVIRKLPYPLRAVLTKSVQTVPLCLWDQLLDLLAPLAPTHTRRLGGKVHSFSEVLKVKSVMDVHRLLMSRREADVSLVPGSRPLPTRFNQYQEWPAKEDVSHMMYLDSVSYLPDDILTKVDRAAMHKGLETRIPLLDHRVVEFAWTLPMSLKLAPGSQKWVLREVLYRYVPRELIERPKRGFSVPLGEWLRGPLRGWAEELLEPSRLEREGFLNSSLVRHRWLAHTARKANWEAWLWNVLAFQAWYARWGGGRQ